jgi:hypothetical protein
MKSPILLLALCCMLLPSEEIAFKPGAVGQDSGGNTQCARTQIDIPKAGKVLDLVFSGKDWSGAMVVWTAFNPTAAGNDAKQWKSLVVTMKRLGGTDDGLLMVSPILKDAKCDKFLKLEKYDPKSDTQRGFAEVVIPLADFGELAAPVIGLHFGMMTKDRDKTAHVQVAKIAFR